MDFINYYKGYHSFNIDSYDLTDKELVLGSFDIPLCTLCTLNCKNCASLMPYYDKKTDFDLEEIKLGVSTLLDVVDFVPRINILGGEPFLSKNLVPIVKLLKSKYNTKIGVVKLTTNGTVLPKEDVLKELIWNKLEVRISKYGQYTTKSSEKLLCRFTCTHYF